MATLSTVTERSKLKARREPHWSKIRRGCYVGFRKMTGSADGTWLARCRGEDGVQAYRALGDFSDVAAHLRFDAASKAAQAWFEHLGRGGNSAAYTVRQACEDYVEHLRESKGDGAAADALTRFQRYVYPQVRLADTELMALTPDAIAKWRKSLRDTVNRSGTRRGERRSDSTLNRDMTCLRAALNLAYRDSHVVSDGAWRGKLVPIKDADRRRDVYLDKAQRRALVEHAQSDLAAFLKGLALLPLRPGALAALTARSFDRRLGILNIGTDKSGADRKIALPPATAQYIAERCSQKTPAAPMFDRSNGKAWDKDAWKYPFKDAVDAANAADGDINIPGTATIYAMRHSAITDLVHSGLDMLTVAQISGTSLRMIEKHYGHLTANQAREGLARLSI